MQDSLAKLVLALKKRYSLPILLLLFFKKELTFDQAYDMCSKYSPADKERLLAAAKRRGVLLRSRSTYKAISRKSVSDALTELKTKRYVTKRAKLGPKGRSYAVYVLTPEIRETLESYLKR